MNNDAFLLISYLKTLVWHWQYAPALLEIFSGESYSKEQLEIAISILKGAMDEVIDASSRETFEKLLSVTKRLQEQELEDKKNEVWNTEAQIDSFFDTL